MENKDRSEAQIMDKDNTRVEYAAAQETYIHYDSYTWQVGAMLIAGVFIYWGFIISNPPELIAILVGNLAVCLLMSCWVLYAGHNRQIYLYKLHRIHELENVLGMCQHRRFKKWSGQDKVYILNAPSGHQINSAIYLIISFGGLIASLSGKNWSTLQWNSIHKWILAITVFVVLVVLWRVHTIINRATELIKKLEQKQLSNS